MTLHTDYQKLSARGMPEVPRLEVRTDEPYGLWWKRSHHSDCDPIPVHEADARDLITMHAMRHFNQWPQITSRGKWLCHDGPVDDNDYGDEWWFGGDGFHERHAARLGDTPLAAILAATEHLQPKE